MPPLVVEVTPRVCVSVVDVVESIVGRSLGGDDDSCDIVGEVIIAGSSAKRALHREVCCLVVLGVAGEKCISLSLEFSSGLGDILRRVRLTGLCGEVTVCVVAYERDEMARSGGARFFAFAQQLLLPMTA